MLIRVIVVALLFNAVTLVKSQVITDVVKPPRRTMCSPECVHELQLRTNGRYLRDCVYKRDKGICKLCNVDTKKIAKEALMATAKMDRTRTINCSYYWNQPVW